MKHFLTDFPGRKSPVIDKIELSGIIGEVYPSAVRLRRAIHANPDLSGHEQGTAAFIGRELRRVGLRPRSHLGKTGVTATIRNGSGPVVVLRADIDALPVGEATGLPYASRRPGIMHACGHDLHTATLLGAAEALLRLRKHWHGTVVLLFQPSEELEPGGARGLIDAGAFPENAAAVFGLHVNPDHPAGTVGLRQGSDFAGVLNFTVTVRGCGGHAGSPQVAVNPINAAAAMIVSLQRLTDATRGGGWPVFTLAIGRIAAGSANNVIPATASFAGTIRTHDKRTEEMIKKRLSKTVADAARRTGASARLSFERSYPPTWNDPALAGRFKHSMASLIGEKNIVARPHPVFYAEDFAYYQRMVPGLYIHLGVRPPRRKSIPSLHNGEFAPDERAMKTGIAAHVAFVAAVASPGD